ncbi:hypothetical protein [Polaribacter sp.]|uniref:hypothetical protein n=1 Tax=Polaribacter sp. TaxID=1920175 RepID=UPI0040487CF1
MDKKSFQFSIQYFTQLKHLTGLILVLILQSSLHAQEAWTDKSRILPTKLRLISNTLTITHSPNPNFPSLTNVSENQSTYVWKHSTTVCSPTQDLEIVEAGSFIWYSPSGWQENMQFSKETFAEKFNCKEGMLKKGNCYTYQKNYRYGNQLYGGDALWYVIAKDAQGNLYKGFGIIETENEIQND